MTNSSTKSVDQRPSYQNEMNTANREEKRVDEIKMANGEERRAGGINTANREGNNEIETNREEEWADNNTTDVEDPVGVKIGYSQSDLLYAIERDDTEKFREILSKNENLLSSVFMEMGSNNLLHVICSSSSLKVDEFLEIVFNEHKTQFKEMLFQNNSQGVLPAEILFDNRNLKALQFLVDSKLFYFFGDKVAVSKDIFKNNIRTFVDDRETELLEILSKAYCYPDEELPQVTRLKMFREKDKKKKDFIYYAVLNGDVWMVEYLLSKNVSLKVNYGSSVYGFREFILDVLKKSNADKKAKAKRRNKTKCRFQIVRPAGSCITHYWLFLWISMWFPMTS